MIVGSCGVVLVRACNFFCYGDEMGNNVREISVFLVAIVEFVEEDFIPEGGIKGSGWCWCHCAAYLTTFVVCRWNAFNV